MKAHTLCHYTKPVGVERVKVHGDSLAGNLEGIAADRDVLVFFRCGMVRYRASMYATSSRARNRSKSPVVTELEYIEPLCAVFESGKTTVEGTSRGAALVFEGDALRRLSR